jgi:Mannosyltransferase (PIG-V)
LVVFLVAGWVVYAGLPAAPASGTVVLTHPFGNWPAGELLDLIFSPLAKWDAQHYLAIALYGYGEGEAAAHINPAFFPMFPELVRVLSGFGTSPGLTLIISYAVPLSCFFGALVLIHRLAAVELGERHARSALMLFSFFPAAFFFGIPYTESLFVLLAAGAFLAARTGNWPLAGIALALASATRAPGLLLVLPVALFYLYGPRADRAPGIRTGLRPRYPVQVDAAWLLLAPVGLLAFSAYLQLRFHDALAWQHAQVMFGRHTIDPLSGLWAGISEAGTSIGLIFSGGYRVPIVDHWNLIQAAFFAFAVVGGVALLRMLPVAYGAWVLASLLSMLVSQPPVSPLWSAPRFVAVLFPLFFWLATLCDRRRVTTTVTAVFAAGMGAFVVQFTLWSFVA